MSKSVVCIGATLVDELYFCEENIVPNSSNPAQKTTSIGGVMSNIVQHLALLEVKVGLLTALGTDAEAEYIKAEFQKRNIDMSESISVADSTGKYVSILKPDGNLYVAVCQDISAKYISIPVLESKAEYLRKFEVLLIDTNLAAATLQWLISFAKINQQILIIEPVSVTKAAKLANLNLEGVYMITPNQEELQVLNPVEIVEEHAQLNALQQRGVTKVWLRKGSQGSLIHTENETIALSVPSITLVDSTGAGDAALAGWLYGFLHNENELTSLQLGHTLAFEILKIKGAVNTTMNQEKLLTQKQTYYHD